MFCEHKPMKVLIVDDEERFARAVGRGLTAEGFDVTLAHDGVSGQHLATRGAFDVIVLDIMLPGRNGFEVCGNLRAAGITTPILMLTAKDGELDEAEALDTGADDYLTKPFHFVVLIARLRALLRRSGPTGHELRVGDLRVLPAEHRVFRGEVEIFLTAREFGILHHLAQRPGAVVSKTELIDELWDFADAPEVNVVEVHVSSLRRKIGPHYIETVRGVGYRLRGETA